MIPGPSGIFLRLTYDPATFARTLDWIVAYGQGAQQGAGSALGLPDTAINDPRRGQDPPARFRRPLLTGPEVPQGAGSRDHRVAGGGPCPTGGRNFGRVSSTGPTSPSGRRIAISSAG